MQIVPKKVYKNCEYKPVASDDYRAGMIKHFAERGISEEVVTRRGIEVRKVWMPEAGKEEWAMVFPFMRGGQIVNAKYRTIKEKHFKMEQGCEPVLYGLDGIDTSLPLIITEGEYDQLSLETVGIKNSVSVPNGANSDLNACLGTLEELLAPVCKVILAGDNDDAGLQLMHKISLRFGPEKCFRVDWPHDCKDANDVLVKYGAETLRKCINDAQPLPIAGVFEVSDLCDSIIDLFTKGPDPGVDPGWSNVKSLYRPRLGEISVITGTPGSGKTAWMNALSVNLAKSQGWQFGAFSPENAPPQRYISQILELYTGKPFTDGVTQRMTQQELMDAMNWAQEHFICIEPEETRTIDSILELARQLIFRRGIQALIIDPWNQVEHNMGAAQETTYIGEKLKKLKRFAWTNQVHIFIIAHPFKMRRDRDGNFPVPTLYDINGSANWYNMTDNGICIHRDKNDESKPVQLHVQKIRFRDVGRLGTAELYFDRVNGRYSEQVPLHQVQPRREKNEAYWRE